MSDTYLPGDTRQRIQDLIKGRKITQAEPAEKVGLSNSALSLYLQGNTKNLGDGFIIRIAKYFDVSTDYLLGISSQDTASGSASPLSPEEEELIDAYRRADEGIKISVCKLLDVKREKAPQIKEA
jgi:transcriptional regulator with XRE-family HTH domain